MIDQVTFINDDVKQTNHSASKTFELSWFNADTEGKYILKERGWL